MENDENIYISNSNNLEEMENDENIYISNSNNLEEIENSIKNMKSHSKTKYKFTDFKYIDENGIKKYRIENIINHLKGRESKALARDLAIIIGEERRDLIEKSLSLIGVELFFSILERCLYIQNQGGVCKKIPNKNEEILEEEPEKKSTGGVLFQLIKKEGGMTKQNIKQLFYIDYKERNQRKKLIKKINKLSI